MKIISLFLFLFVACISLAQENITFKKVNFPNDKEGLSIAKKAIYRGNIHLENKDYTLALSNFEKAQAFNQNNDIVNLKMGICYFQLSNDSLAERSFDKAYQLNNEVTSRSELPAILVLMFEMCLILLGI